MRLAGRRIGVEAQIRVLHGTVDAAAERHTKNIGEAEVIAAPAGFVVQRRGKRREHAPATPHVLADRAALRIRQRGGIGENEQLEAIETVRCEERLVNHFEWDA